jgi:hypothetical protein
MRLRSASLSGLLGLAAALSGCAGGLAMKPPQQGLEGTFTTYGPPAALADCSALKTQFQKDSCRHGNERVIEEPYQGTLKIRNVATRKAVDQALDAQGAYRIVLEPGTYEVCVNGECSDPIEVRMRGFATYGQRLPRPAPAAPSDKANAAGPER